MNLFNELEQAIFKYVLNSQLPVTGVQIAAHVQVSTQEALGIAIGFTGIGIFDQVKTDQTIETPWWEFWNEHKPIMAYTITDHGKGTWNQIQQKQRQNNFGGLIPNPT